MVRNQFRHFFKPKSIQSSRFDFFKGAKLFLFGPPRDFNDKSIFSKISLVAFFAWVGLGADGLSSSCYGPEEAFRSLKGLSFLALPLGLAVILTISIISLAYSKIIEEFPYGGGGYVVATKLLGDRMGVVSGCALLVDYVLTIAVSIAASCDALFSFLPPHWQPLKLGAEVLVIVFLMVLNIRGIKESVLVLTPIFILFLLTHIPAIGYGIISHLPDLGSTTAQMSGDFKGGFATLGLAGMGLLLLHSYSLGAGTYTGLEAVSNGLPIIREPRVHNGKRTMLYMALSLSFMAAGLLVCYYLFKVTEHPGKTLNAVFLEKLFAHFPLSHPIIIVALLSESVLLVVAGQAGFIDGPRVLANMALDYWVPRSLSALSERLTTRNGVLMMSGASLAALIYARGNIHHLVVMYSINVFLTFSISMFAMARLFFSRRKQKRNLSRFLLFVLGLIFCAGILVINIIEKFGEGGWLTLAITSSVILLCFLIRRHYRYVAARFRELFSDLENLPPEDRGPIAPVDPEQPTAVVLVANYNGLGIHSILRIFRMFPDYYQNLIFLSVGVIDSGGFKGRESIAELKERTEENLKKYVEFSKGIGIPADYRLAIGTNAVEEAEKLCLEIAGEFPGSTFFAGKIVFPNERWYHRILHNETAFAIQKRLQLSGQTMVIIPASVGSGLNL